MYTIYRSWGWVDQLLEAISILERRNGIERVSASAENLDLDMEDKSECFIFLIKKFIFYGAGHFFGLSCITPFDFSASSLLCNAFMPGMGATI